MTRRSRRYFTLLVRNASMNTAGLFAAATTVQQTTQTTGGLFAALDASLAGAAKGDSAAQDATGFAAALSALLGAQPGLHASLLNGAATPVTDAASAGTAAADIAASTVNTAEAQTPANFASQIAAHAGKTPAAAATIRINGLLAAQTEAPGSPNAPVAGAADGDLPANTPPLAGQKTTAAGASDTAPQLAETDSATAGQAAAAQALAAIFGAPVPAQVAGVTSAADGSGSEDPSSLAPATAQTRAQGQASLPSWVMPPIRQQVQTSPASPVQNKANPASIVIDGAAPQFLAADPKAAAVAEQAAMAAATEAAAPQAAAQDPGPGASPALLAFAQQIAGSKAIVQGRVLTETTARTPASKAGADTIRILNPASAAADEMLSPLATTADTAIAPQAPANAAESDPALKFEPSDPAAAGQAHGETPPDNAALAALASAGAAAAPLPQGALPLATPQTVSQLANAVAGQAGKATRFQVELNPDGLGKVDVQIGISARGELTAAMNFQTPHAASELSARASELQSALQQAGFDVASSALTFTSGDPSGQGLGSQQQQQQRQADAPAWRQSAFSNLADASDAPATPRNRPNRAGGVDVTI